MRRLLLLLIVVSLLWASSVPAEEAVKWTEKPDKAVAAAPGDAELGPTKLRDWATRKERRAMGLTILNLRRILLEMKKAGELEGNTRAVIAAQVAGQLRMDNPQAFDDVRAERGLEDPGDWSEFLTALLSFLEAILPFIMILFGI